MTAEPAIRLARAAFNRALAAGDLTAIGAVLAPDVVLVAGTDSAVLVGRKAQLAAWKREFAAPPALRTVYLRSPGTIIASPVAPIAHEQGEWRGTSVATGAVEAHGTYSAKWRNVARATEPPRWLLEAEIFVTLG